MKKLLSLVMIMAVAICGISAVQAADDKPKPKRDPEKVFKRLDKNKDNKLSLEEFIGKRTGEKKEKAEKVFKRKDKDNDGSLTLEEFKFKKKKKKK